jgi:hypothetical protein
VVAQCGMVGGVVVDFGRVGNVVGALWQYRE